MTEVRPSHPFEPFRPLRTGDVIPARRLPSVTGPPVAVPDPGSLVHLQFRRFAGCPICHLHLRSFVRRHDELVAAGVREVVVFHTSDEELRRHTGALPFAVVPDPGKDLYRRFGVESSPRALLSPRAWWPILRAVAHALVGLVRGTQRAPSLRPEGGRFGLPGDVLLGPDGTVLEIHHGTHADDQWSVDRVLDLTSRHRIPDPTARLRIPDPTAAEGPGLP